MFNIATTATDLVLLEHPPERRDTKRSVASSTVMPSRCDSRSMLRSIRGPRTGPGDRLLTVIPSGPTSAASVVVRPITAIFEAQ